MTRCNLAAVLVALGAAFAPGAFGCGGTGGHPPTARLTLTPAYVPLGDQYTTDVELDGRASADALDDPRAEKPLRFAWIVEDGNAHPAPDATSADVTVRVAGDRPVTVRLTVTDESGESSTVAAQIGVTLP